MLATFPPQPTEISAIGERLIDKYAGKNLEGLNMERIGSYLDAYNLLPRPNIVITPSDFEDVMNIDTTGMFEHDFLMSGAEGSYSAIHGLSVVMRQARLEYLNGTNYTESLIIHESAHSSTKQSLVTYDAQSDDFVTARIGFAVGIRTDRRGAFLEEAWADYHRGNYLGLHFDTSKFKDVPTIFNNNVTSPDDNVTVSMDGVTNVQFVPAKYLLRNANGTPFFMPSTYAGYALELMMKSDPEFYSAMNAARSDNSGLRDVAQRIEQASKGLYKDLQKLTYSPADFMRGLKMTQYRMLWKIECEDLFAEQQV